MKKVDKYIITSFWTLINVSCSATESIENDSDILQY